MRTLQSLKHLRGQHDQARHGRHGGSSASIDVNRANILVSSYLGKKPEVKELKVLDSREFDRRFGSPDDEIHGGVSAIRTPDGRIFIREGFESDSIHELIHAAGALEEGTNTFLNEGVTQAAAERIGKLAGTRVRETYGRETDFVNRYVLPSVGISERRFFQGYVRADNKAKYVADLVWKKYGNKFSDADEWGRNPYSKLLSSLEDGFATNPYLMYLVDDLGI